VHKPDIRFPGLMKALRWMGRILFGGMIILFAQAAWASLFENELRAAVIYLSIAIVLVLGALISYVSRYFNQQ
jgi:hypothetical protein